MLAEMLSWVLNLPPLVYVAVALGTALYMKTRSGAKVTNIPPVPVRPYPIVGHIPMLMWGQADVLRRWRKKAGDIFSVYMGSDLLIFINSYSIMKEAFVKHADVFSDRPKTYASQYLPYGNMGIINNSGPDWKEQRTVALSILRNFGMGKNLLANKINEEVAVLLQALSDSKGEPTNPQVLMNLAVSNVICALLVGHRFEYDDPDFKMLVRLLNENMVLLANLPTLSAFPWLRFLPGDRFDAKRFLSNGSKVRVLFSERFVKATLEEGGETDNFINAYYNEMNKKRNAGLPTYLTETSLLIVMTNLFVAGTETSSTSLLWCLLYAIHNPDTQEKVYSEIASVIGTERQPSMQDKAHMNYTNAFILETLRHAAIGPTTLPHMCNKDIEISGYTIPEEATVFANLMEILHDEEVWGDPDVFRPERFLDTDNSILPMQEEFVPFSLGRRYCMGESLAKMEMFLFLTGLFQRFEVKPEDPDNLPSLKPKFGGTNMPQPFKVRLVERS